MTTAIVEASSERPGNITETKEYAFKVFFIILAEVKSQFWYPFTHDGFDIKTP